jgi:hypothetical protein
MISLNVKAWLENIVLGLLMGAKGCADLSAFRAPAVNIGHFLGISCGCRRVQPRRLQKAALWPRSFSAAAYWPAAYPPYGCGCSSGVEHNLAKVGVEGSNPFARSKITLSHSRYRLELLALFADVRRRKRPWFLGAD